MHYKLRSIANGQFDAGLRFYFDTIRLQRDKEMEEKCKNAQEALTAQNGNKINRVGPIKCS